MLKVLICCIAKEENQYIREFVEYYKKLGATNVMIFDNNVDSGEHFEYVIKDYIDEGYVIMKDYRNRKVCQLAAYQECYDNYNKDYDWICFFDCDEFLAFRNKRMTIPEFLANKRFDEYDMIHVNWMLYGDNDLLENDGRPVVERFKKPIMPFNIKIKYPFPENNHIKAIVRGGVEGVVWKGVSHTPSEPLACCDPVGKPCKSTSPFNEYNFSEMWLNHYTTKTVSEFADKINRGFPDTVPGRAQEIDMAKRFFKYCKRSPEKVEIIKQKTGIDLDVEGFDCIVFERSIVG